MRPLLSLARAGAQATFGAYESYRREFQRITGRARQRFEERDWKGGQRDASERLELYRQFVEEVVSELEQILGEQIKDAAVWRTMKALFSEAVAGFTDVELAQTFFNSVTRRVFATVGVDPDVEFVDLDIRRDRYGPGSTIHRRHFRSGSTRDLVAEALAELYISLGYPKHGKTEMYRDLLGHMQRSMDVFEHARGEPGMVMIVFDLRSYDYVFKVIRDRFAAPKTNTRADVERRYRLVFQHDRAGRLIEAQEFEHVTFERRRFSPALLEELSAGAARTVVVDAEEVHIRHLYVERRVQPLDLYLRQASDEAAVRIVEDYGQAIRDLATTNIFPGDLLLKNFGVTRHGRVTFYDYDELSLVTDCEFRDLPTARDTDEEMASEPWFYVGEHDVFPEEFLPFLGLNGELRRVFLEAHGEVLTAAFWRKLKERHRAGEVLDVLPYPSSRRLGRR